MNGNLGFWDAKMKLLHCCLLSHACSVELESGSGFHFIFLPQLGVILPIILLSLCH